jgi:hypothetical protein
MTGPKLLDVEAIARHYGVARGTVGRWACEDRWVKYGTRRRRLYDLAEVQESFERRHPDSEDMINH